MLRIVSFTLCSVLIASCSLLDTNEGTVTVTLEPESVQLRDNLSLTLAVTNTTTAPIWYWGCGQVQERWAEGEWQAHGAVTCYLEPEGVRISPGTTFTTNTPLYVRESGTYRLRINLTNENGETLLEETRLTHTVTVTQ